MIDPTAGSGHIAGATSSEPTAHYAELRDQCPLHHVADHEPSFYVLSRFDDIVAVLKQPDLWRNGDGPGVFYQEHGVLGTTDEPDHGRHRRVLRQSLTPTSIARMEPRLREITDELIDAFVEAGECEFVGAFAAPLPALAIAELLGIEGDHRDSFRHWSDLAVAALAGGDMAGYHEAKGNLEAHVEAGCAARFALLDGGDELPDDVLSVLSVARRDGTISGAEARHLGYQLLVAGHETTTSLLGLMLRRLVEHPAVMAALRSDPGRIPDAVEETLRLDSPVHGLFRTNERDDQMHGTVVPERSKLQLAFAAANRDPAHFSDPDEFRIDRDRHEIGRHVAFGWGIHHCIGAPLARLETKVAFEQILRRLTNIEIVGPVERNDSFVLHGLTRLPIRFDPA